ncbi:MAG: hypothetical protein ACREJM_12350, partial [Candidatus Saccharimonadales bacterium]
MALGAFLPSAGRAFEGDWMTQDPASPVIRSQPLESANVSSRRKPSSIVQISQRRHGAADFGQPEDEPVEETFPRTPFFDMPHVVVNDPADYPRPPGLDNYNPNSFFYSLRPNIFNVPVEPEWDFYNIINTDRPDFTDAVYSVGKGVTILETGYTFHKQNTAETHFSTRQLPESLLRYGVTDEFELRLKWPGYL